MQLVNILILDKWDSFQNSDLQNGKMKSLLFSATKHVVIGYSKKETYIFYWTKWHSLKFPIISLSSSLNKLFQDQHLGLRHSYSRFYILSFFILFPYD